MLLFLLIILICNLSQIFCQDELCIKKNLTENNCNLKITFLEEKEKVFLTEVCKKYSKLNEQSEIVFIHDGEVNSTGKIDMCHFISNDIQLAWLSLKAYQNRLQFLNKYQKTLIAKTSNETLSTSSFCTFEMTTKSCGVDLIHSIKPNFANEIFLLVQLLPLTYTIFDINYKLWRNATSSDREAPMGKIILSNFQNNNEKIYDTIRYGFHEKFKYNSTEIAKNLKGQYEYNKNYIDINEDGEGSIYRKLNYTFSHIMPARSYVNVSLIGIWADNMYEISSAIFQFDYGSKYVTTRHIENFPIIVSKIIHLRTEFTHPLSLDTNEIIDYNPIMSKLNAKADQLTLTEFEISDEYLTQQGSIYPGFHPYFITGCIVVVGVIVVSLLCVIKSLINDRQKLKYRQVPVYHK